MRRLSLSLLTLAAFSVASAQVQTASRLPAEKVFQGQKSVVTFVVKNLSARDFLFTRQNCHPELKILRVSDGENMLPDTATACIGSTPPVEIVKAGTRREFTLSLPPLPAGDYLLKTNFLPGPYLKTAPTSQTNLRIGPGPFFARLTLSAPAKAGQPSPLEVAFTNIWKTPAWPRLCQLGLIVRNVNARIVYDNKAERQGCKTSTSLQSLQAGKTLRYPLKLPVRLPAGQYTAILWGDYNDTLRFEVKK